MEGVYEAALDPGVWDEALTRFVNTFAPKDWDVAMLMWESTAAPEARFVGASGLAAHARELYLAHFVGRNPWSAALASLPIGRLVDSDDMVPRDEFLASAFYKHFLATWAMTRGLALNLDRQGQQRLSLAMPGPDGPDLTVLKRGLRLIAPHIQRAVRVSRRLAAAELSASAAQAALSMAPAGIVTLTDQLMVINANLHAQELAGAGLARIEGGRWCFRDPEAQATLSALATAPQPGSAAFTAKNGGENTCAALAVRIATHQRATLDGYLEGAAILLTLGVSEKARDLPLDNLAAWYGLTPTEAKLASALSSGQTLGAFAMRRGVSQNAARFLLRGVLRKTGAPDQARLVALLRDLPHGGVQVD